MVCMGCGQLSFSWSTFLGTGGHEARASIARCTVQPSRPFMTLRPQDSKWKEDRDRRAIESEFIGNADHVDLHMAVLRERMAVLVRKEKQWKELCNQFSALSFLTGIPMLTEDNTQPTATAWLFVFLSIAVPLYLLYCVSEWLYSASVSFSHML